MSQSVSVVVPNYNGGELFRDCVRSLCRLDATGIELDVHVVDDGSTDGSGDWLSSESLPDFVHVHPQPVNRGRSAARNVGLEFAKGEIIVFLDGDLTVEPDFAIRHVEAHGRRGVHAVVGRVTAAKGVRQNNVVRYLYEFPGRGARQFVDAPVPPQFVVTNNLSMRRDLLDAVGGLDNRFEGYGGEDTLLGLRIEERHPGGIRFAAGPVAYDYDEHELGTLLKKFEHYGRVNLARLIEAAPHAAAGLHANWLIGSPLKRLLGRMIFNRPVDLLVRLVIPVVPYPLSNTGIRYLLGSAVVRGYRTHLQEVNQAAERSRPGSSLDPSPPDKSAAAA